MKRADILVYICLGVIFFLLIGLEIIDQTKTIQEENRKIPSPYYDLLRPKLPSGNKFFDLMKIKALETTLKGIEWSNPYEMDVFDCSEQASYLERYLENRGFHTKIAWGATPYPATALDEANRSNWSELHAWVMVEVSNESWLPVAPQGPYVVSPKDEYYQNYFNYREEFETIYDACRYNYEEFDWWN